MQRTSPKITSTEERKTGDVRRSRMPLVGVPGSATVPYTFSFRLAAIG